jgi:hypothetical protein
MKKMAFLTMGLAFAFSASASPPTLVVETGPEMGSGLVINTSAPAAEYIAIQAELGNINMISSASYGRETVPDPSDHTGGNTNYLLNYVMTTSMTVNSALAAVEPDRRTCASNNVMKDRYNLDPSTYTGLAATKATAPGILERHSVPAVTSYLSGGPSRC